MNSPRATRLRSFLTANQSPTASAASDSTSGAQTLTVANAESGGLAEAKNPSVIAKTISSIRTSLATNSSAARLFLIVLTLAPAMALELPWQFAEDAALTLAGLAIVALAAVVLLEFADDAEQGEA